MLLIKELLDMSRIDAGKLSLNKKICHIEDVLNVARSRLNILTAHHDLKFIIPSGLPGLYLDTDRIAQVITNLVENAVKFSREGTSITLEVRSDNDSLIISVKDRGEGITAEVQEKLFDRFYQAERVSQRKNKRYRFRTGHQQRHRKHSWRPNPGKESRRTGIYL